MAEEREEALKLAREVAHRGKDFRVPPAAEAGEGRVAECRQILGPEPFGDRTAVFAQGRVSHPMQTIFDRAPVSSNQLLECPRIGFRTR